jgi:hypothetical protein
MSRGEIMAFSIAKLRERLAELDVYPEGKRCSTINCLHINLLAIPTSVDSLVKSFHVIK